MSYSRLIEELKLLDEETSKALTHEERSFYRVRLSTLLKKANIQLIHGDSGIYFVLKPSNPGAEQGLELVNRAINVIKRLYLDPKVYLILASEILEKY